MDLAFDDIFGLVLGLKKSWAIFKFLVDLMIL